MLDSVILENNICGVVFRRINENEIEVLSQGRLYKTIQRNTKTKEDFIRVTNEYFLYNW